jgi:hypothetical protein
MGGAVCHDFAWDARAEAAAPDNVVCRPSSIRKLRAGARTDRFWLPLKPVERSDALCPAGASLAGRE